MMLHVPGVLSSGELASLRERLDGVQWIDGRATVGDQGSKVKRNSQVRADSALGRELSAHVEAAVRRHAMFFAAALPLKISAPLFNRYRAEEDQHYGFHVDGAMRGMADARWMRTDLSATLFLSEPDDYDGGDLTVRDTYGDHEVKLPAGDLILYPSTSLHSVSNVTRGQRVSAFFWIQSMVRYDHQRVMLYELDQTIQSLRGDMGDTDATLNLSNLYHNLLREWADS